MQLLSKSKSTLFFMIASCLNIAIALGHTFGFIRMMGKDQDLIGSAVWGMMQNTMSSLAALGLAIWFFPVPPIVFLVLTSRCFALSMF